MEALHIGLARKYVYGQNCIDNYAVNENKDQWLTCPRISPFAWTHDHWLQWRIAPLSFADAISKSIVFPCSEMYVRDHAPTQFDRAIFYKIPTTPTLWWTVVQCVDLAIESTGKHHIFLRSDLSRHHRCYQADHHLLKQPPCIRLSEKFHKFICVA